MSSGSKCLCNEVYLHGSSFHGEGLPAPYDRHGKIAESVVVTCSAFMELFNLTRAQLYVKGCGTP